ncbi:hypothetical protein [Pseudonocardia acidicola]|nr:hypothetical protein [Pseudonocardia acidicola]
MERVRYGLVIVLLLATARALRYGADTAVLPAPAAPAVPAPDGPA